MENKETRGHHPQCCQEGDITGWTVGRMQIWHRPVQTRTEAMDTEAETLSSSQRAGGFELGGEQEEKEF